MITPSAKKVRKRSLMLKMNESCALKKLVVPSGIQWHEGLKAACQLRGVRLI